MSPLLFWSSLLSVLLLGAGLAAALLMDAGYVWIIWQGWEIQSSVAMLLLALVLLWLMLVVGWWLVAAVWRWYRRQQRQQQIGQQQTQQHVLTHLVLAQAIGDNHLVGQLLTELERSPFAQLIQQRLGQAQTADSHTHHDIAVLLRAQIALDHQQYAALEPLLNCLMHWPEHPAQDLLPKPLRQAYVQHLYAQWAMAQPWQVLDSRVFTPCFAVQQWHAWLNALYQQSDQANAATWQVLLDYFDQQQPEFKQSLAGSWLRVLTEYAPASPRAVQLGVEVLRQQFCPTILYDWLRSARSLIEPVQIAPVLSELQTRYAGQPALQLAQAYWCAVQHDPQQAEQWVLAWPNAVLQHRLQALLSLDQLVRPSRLAAPLFVFDVIEAER